MRRYLVKTDFMAGLLLVIMGSAILLIVLLIISTIWGAMGFTHDRVEIEPIIALSNASSVSGSFFLGCGSIEGELVYTYMVRSTNGHMQMKQISASGTYIVENTNANPRIERTVTKSNMWPNANVGHQTVIYIPEGSVYQGYNVDVRNK